jgi:hypothetical protein
LQLRLPRRFYLYIHVLPSILCWSEDCYNSSDIVQKVHK